MTCHGKVAAWLVPDPLRRHVQRSLKNKHDLGAWTKCPRRYALKLVDLCANFDPAGVAERNLAQKRGGLFGMRVATPSISAFFGLACPISPRG